MDTTVQQFAAFSAAMLGLASLVMFLFLSDYAARLLRPSTIVWRVAESAIEVLQSVHPRMLGDAYEEVVAEPLSKAPDAVVVHEGRSGTVLAVNQEALVREAHASGSMIEFVPCVGDFVAVGEPLFRIYGGTPGASYSERLRAAVAIGAERTMEQDPTFGFRILCDIALKALSKAINDPTTAVLAIDQLHRLLRIAGMRHLQHDRITDNAGRVLVIVRTPNWQDYVHLACREIRLQAVENIQVPRRLRALLENLLSTLPVSRHPALRQELELLDQTVQFVFRFPEDIELARTPDSQGMGGVTTRTVEPRTPAARVADAA
jgi:uncharacterized membrane protein